MIGDYWGEWRPLIMKLPFEDDNSSLIPEGGIIYFKTDYVGKEGQTNNTLIQQYGIGPHRVTHATISVTSGLGYSILVEEEVNRVDVVTKEIRKIKQLTKVRVKAERCLISPPTLVEYEEML